LWEGSRKAQNNLSKVNHSGVTWKLFVDLITKQRGATEQLLILNVTADNYI